jgi:hypothetical protein
MYQVDAVVAKARSSFSPRVVLRGIHRWSMISIWGFALFILGVVGYAIGAALILAGVGKIIAPHQFGARVEPNNFFDIGVNNDPAARDVLGWWLVPVGLAGGTLLFLLTTRLLCWTLRFARIRRPTNHAAAA